MPFYGAGGTDPELDVGFGQKEVEDTPPTYQSSEKEQYNAVANMTQDMYRFTNKSDAGPRIEIAAAEWRSQHGDWPNAADLLGWSYYHQILQPLRTGTYALPDYFWLTTTQPLPYFGIEQPGSHLLANDPLLGPRATGTMLPSYLPSGVGVSVWRQTAATTQEDIERGIGDTTTTIPAGTYLGVPGVEQGFTEESLAAYLAGYSPVRGPSGGGGTGRAPAVFDRANLVENARTLWQKTLVEDSPEKIERYVDDYISEASSFWSTKGGQLDFGTYLMNKMRGTARYQTLYSRKPDWQNEAEYMGQYTANVQPFGFSERVARREIEAGATSGAGAMGFTERVSRTREASQQPGFAQKFGNVLGNMGSLARS